MGRTFSPPQPWFPDGPRGGWSHRRVDRQALHGRGEGGQGWCEEGLPAIPGGDGPQRGGSLHSGQGGRRCWWDWEAGRWHRQLGALSLLTLPPRPTDILRGGVSRRARVKHELQFFNLLPLCAVEFALGGGSAAEASEEL